MTIGIDIDDTIINTYETILPMISVNYGISLNKLFDTKPSYRKLHTLLPNYMKFACSNYPVVAKIAPLKKNVLEVLKKINEDGHKIVFITARNYEEYKDPYKISYNYLKRNGIPFDKLIVNVKDKGLECVAEKVDLFIDDSTRNCKAVKNKGIKTLQFYTPFTEKNKHVQSVSSWDEIYKIICSMSS